MAKKASRATSDSTRVDDYIAKAPEYARPILTKIRKAFHKGCPRLEEKIKWGCPHFDYMGMLGGMAAFKRHVGFGFWKAKLLSDPHGLFERSDAASMCTVRIDSLRSLPPERVLVAYVKEAVKLNEQGIKVPQKSKAAAVAIKIPLDFKRALARSKRAQAVFNAFSPSHRREYLEWIAEAKREETRTRRIAKAITWLGAGKPRNWRYMPKTALKAASAKTKPTAKKTAKKKTKRSPTKKK